MGAICAEYFEDQVLDYVTKPYYAGVYRRLDFL